jgi:heme exporter protein D
MAEFLDMGGHGFYIWFSYAVVILVLGYHYFAPLQKRKKLIRNLVIFHKGNPDQ